MNNNNSLYELANACFLLFGPLFHFSEETLNYLQPKGIKKAYREKAKLYHPDTSILKNQTINDLSVLFNELNNAYKLLLSHIEKKFYPDNNNYYFFILNNNFAKNSNYYNLNNDFFYTGMMPKRKLRIGEYLYYSKNISWKSLINAIVSQYKSRPKIGDLCLKFKYLNSNEINNIIKNIKTHEKFGDTAKRLGLLSDYQIFAVIGFQKKYNRYFGKYFIENNIFTTDELELFVEQCRNYNKNIYKKTYQNSI
jgi:hypothetical protein